MNARKELAVAVLRAVRQVFAVTLGVPIVKRRSMTLGKAPQLRHSACGFMSLSGDFEGRVAVAPDPQLARELAALLAGIDPVGLSESEVRDGVGEIINQVAGKAVTLLDEQGIHLTVGLPSFAPDDERGRTINVAYPRYALIFDCLGRQLAIYVYLVETTPPGRP